MMAMIISSKNKRITFKQTTSMKLLQITFLILFLTLQQINAQQTLNQKDILKLQKTDLSTDFNLKTTKKIVPKIIYTRYAKFDAKQTVLENYNDEEHHFNNKQQLVEFKTRVYYGENKTGFWKTTSCSYKKNKLIKVNFLTDGKLKATDSYSYKKRKLVKRISRFNDALETRLFSYIDDQIIELYDHKSDDNSYHYKLIYDLKNNVIQSKTYIKEGTSDSKMYYKYKNNYAIEFDKDNSSFEMILSEKGDIIKNVKGDNRETFNFSYEYDKYNNWVIQYKYPTDEDAEFKIRKILYSNGDVTGYEVTNNLTKKLLQMKLNMQQQICKETTFFEVTKAFSKSIDKPEVHFSIEVPKCLTFYPATPEKKGSSYMKVEKHNENGVIQQMLSLGYVKLSSKDTFEESSLDFLWQLRNILVKAGFVFEEEESLVKKFDGKKYPLFQAIGTLKNNPNHEYNGRYYLKAVVVPNPNGDTNILFYMIVRDDQNISHYQDFADRLEISKIWQSFKYLGNE
jgi:hypothetical protein